MAEIIAADPDRLKNSALDHYVDRVDDMTDSYHGTVADIGSPLRHKERGDIDKSATKLVEDTGASVVGVLEAVRALVSADHGSVQKLANDFANSEEDRAILAGGSGDSTASRH
ncbi:hypothetical protein [Paractinoplanes atraurantiacus]|uniref:Uncharacterized protein n=1 Tax=Paractinoplanes atraurantiacus TaxID=1036182 RepID=A0A285KB93_9ACTN|nr:hypothetical protein [Actinoplanes atraurantiacus]SNY69874.1 hypothetical protein SAMN05421748_13633 [Actinoplanes atraurantiacus]